MSKKKQPSGPSSTGPRPTPTPTPNSKGGNGRAANAAPTPSARPIQQQPVRAAASATRPQSAPLRPVTPRAASATPAVSLPIERRSVAWWPPVLLAAIGFVLYINTFHHGYALDDIAAISQNLFVKAGLKGIPDLLRTEFWHFSNISLGYYRPLSLITFAVEWEFFKENSGVSHQINTVLYALTGLFLGVLLQKWLVVPAAKTANETLDETARHNRQTQILMATLIGVLFMAHPLHTEIVANIKGRDEVLSFLFITLMLLFYWGHLEHKQPSWIRQNAGSMLGGVGASLVGGVLGGLLIWGLVAKKGVSLPTQIESSVSLMEIIYIGIGAVAGFVLVTAVYSTVQQQRSGKQGLWWENATLQSAAIGVALTTIGALVGAYLVWTVRAVPDIKFAQAMWVGVGAAVGSLLVTNWLGLACFSLYLAFLSKESSIVSLAFIPAAQYWFARRNVWQSMAALWPFLIVTVVFFYQKQVMIGTLAGKPPVDWANYPYAIEKTQLPNTFKFFAYYLKLLILPHPLVYDYSYNVIPSSKGAQIGLVWLGFAAFAGLAWLAFKGFMKRTLWGFGLYWFFIAMVPGLGFILSRGGILAERFLYAAVLGFAFVAVWGLQALLKLATTRKTTAGEAAFAPTKRPILVQYAPLIALLAIVAGLYSFKTVTRNKDWKNNFVLFNSALPSHDTSCQVQRHVANEWIEKGLKDRSKADSIAAAVNKIKPKPSPEQIRKAQVLIDTNINRANIHGRWALDHLKEATRIYPNFGEAYFSMAYVFQRITPNRDSAVYYYKQTIKAANAYAPAYNNLGVIYQNEGGTDRKKLELASYYYNQSMVVNPAYADGRNNHAALMKMTGLDVRTLPDSILQKY
jgi:hypothetical protein